MRLKELVILLEKAEDVKDIDDKRERIAELIPAVKRMFEFDQMNDTHQYDLWNHSLHTVVNLPKGIPDDMLYLAALLHDIGKPQCQTIGKREGDNNMHYYGHPLKGMEIIREEVIPELIQKDSVVTQEEERRLLYYIAYHDDRVSLRLKHVRRHLQLASFNDFQNLMLLQVADAEAHVQVDFIKDRIDICSKMATEEGQELYLRLQKGE